MKYYANIVKEAICNPKTVDFKTFVRNCLGCCIIDCVAELKKIGNIPKAKHVLEDMLNYSQIDVERLQEVNYKPMPHMIDSDWRFTKQSAQYLLNRVKTLLKENSRCLLVGTPSLVNLGLQHDNIQYTLIERNQTSLVYDNKIYCDILKYDTEIKYDCIVCDPPWYKNTYLDFGHKFSNLIVDNGYVIIVFPPIGVRESICNEYDEIVKFYTELGLELICNELQTISYISSPFEINSIKNNNIYKFPIDWRTGNLCIFKKNARKTSVKYRYNKALKTDWDEFIVENIRFFIKNDTIELQHAFINKIFKNDILPSVSMRNEKLKDVNLWTSGNRVFKCNNTALLVKLLAAMEKYGVAKSKLQYPNSIECISFIEDIIIKEKDEYAKYW
ncbi:MAG: hypothetical protein R3Y65_03515 [Bacillota bacterium]